MLLHWNFVCWVACSTWPKNEFLRCLAHSERVIRSFWTGMNLKCTSGRALSQSFWPGCLSVVGSFWLQCFSTASLNAMGPDSGTQAKYEWRAGWREGDVHPPSADQASWVGSEGQLLQSGVLSVGSLAQTPFLVVTGSAGNLSAADSGCVCPLFTLTLPLQGSALQGCGVSLVA